MLSFLKVKPDTVVFKNVAGEHGDNTPKDTEPWKSSKRSKCCSAESVESNLQTIQSKEKVGGAFMYMEYVNDSHFYLQAHVIQCVFRH